MSEIILNIDKSILIWIQENLRSDVLTPILKAITTLGNAGLIWILVSVIMLIPKKTRKAGIISLMALMCSYLVNNVFLKNVVARMRPFDRFKEIIPLVARPTDYSFPSGHTACAFASSVTFIGNLPKRYGVAFMVFAVIMALSRLYVGVHYPTDVIVGLISGAVMGMVAQWLYDMAEKKFSAKALEKN